MERDREQAECSWTGIVGGKYSVSARVVMVLDPLVEVHF
jgi:hypothetical protein